MFIDGYDADTQFRTIAQNNNIIFFDKINIYVSIAIYYSNIIPHVQFNSPRIIMLNLHSGRLLFTGLDISITYNLAVRNINLSIST